MKLQNTHCMHKSEQNSYKGPLIMITTYFDVTGTLREDVQLTARQLPGYWNSLHVGTTFEPLKGHLNNCHSTCQCLLTDEMVSPQPQLMMRLSSSTVQSGSKVLLNNHLKNLL